MEKSKSIISWGQLFLIVGTMCLFLFALTQRVTFEKQPEIEIVPVQGFVMSGGTITGYDGDETTLVIPGTYSLGPTTNMSGSITFNNRDEAWDFLQEHYAVGTEGYYDFYREIYSQTYPWIYNYSIDKPSYIEGTDFKITSITADAFKNNKTLEKVVIPSTIERIGNFAFQYCENLKEVELNEGLKTIGDSTFWGCGIKKISIPNSVETIMPYAFFYCHDLEEVEIGEGLKDINNGTLNGCENLKKVTIKSKHDIEAWTTDVYQIFSRCTSLEVIYVYEDRLTFFKNTSPWSLYSSYYKKI